MTLLPYDGLSRPEIYRRLLARAADDRAPWWWRLWQWVRRR